MGGAVRLLILQLRLTPVVGRGPGAVGRSDTPQTGLIHLNLVLWVAGAEEDPPCLWGAPA